MEGQDILNVDNEADLYVLHYTYFPVINKCLNQFTAAYNSHPLSTEHNRTPIQIWTEGVIAIENQHQTGVQKALDSSFGIDPQAPAPGANADVDIVVPPVNLQLSEYSVQQIAQLATFYTGNENLGQVNYFIDRYLMIKGVIDANQ